MKKVYEIVVRNFRYAGEPDMMVHCLAKSVTHAAARGLARAQQIAKERESGGISTLQVVNVTLLCELDI